MSDLFGLLLDFEDQKQIEKFLCGMLTKAQVRVLTARFEIVRRLWTTHHSYRDIAEDLKVSKNTVLKIAQAISGAENLGLVIALNEYYGPPQRRFKFN